MNPAKKGICYAQPSRNNSFPSTGLMTNNVAISVVSPDSVPSSRAQSNHPISPPAIDKKVALKEPNYAMEKDSLSSIKKILRDRGTDHLDICTFAEGVSDQSPIKNKFCPAGAGASAGADAGADAGAGGEPTKIVKTSLADENSGKTSNGPRDYCNNRQPQLNQTIRYNSHIKNYLTPQSNILQQMKPKEPLRSKISQSAEYFRNRRIFMNLEQLTQTNNLRFLQQMEFLRLNKFNVTSRSDEMQAKFKKLDQNTVNGSNYQSIARSIR